MASLTENEILSLSRYLGVYPSEIRSWFELKNIKNDAHAVSMREGA